MKEKVRTGVIGLGKMGILHSALVNMLPEAELVAVHDTNKKLSKYVNQSGLHVDFYPDLDRMLECVDLDAVFICTPPFTRLSIAKKCVEQGLDVFVEKPLAESYESARQMVKMVRDKEIVHAVGYTIAHIPLYVEAENIIRQNVLGRIFKFNISVYLSQVFSKKKGWLFDKSKSGGGVIIDIASHLLYLVAWYFGLPRTIYAKTMSIYSDVEDSGTILMDYDNGLSGFFDANWSLPNFRQTTYEVILEGENGFMEISNDYIKMNLHKACSGFQQGWTYYHKSDIGSASRFDLGSEGFCDEDLHFLKCSRDRKLPRAHWEKGLLVQKIIEAAYRSAEMNKPVDLNEMD